MRNRRLSIMLNFAPAASIMLNVATTRERNFHSDSVGRTEIVWSGFFGTIEIVWSGQTQSVSLRLSGAKFSALKGAGMTLC